MSPDEVIAAAVILVADASPKIGVTNVGLVTLTILPDPVVAMVLKTPCAEFATTPATLNPAIVAPAKVGELASSPPARNRSHPARSSNSP